MTEKKEYIEREAALRSLFRAPSLSGEQSSDDLTDLILCVARKQIRNVPAADVVEVVRCKDCKYNDDNGGGCNRTITHTSRNLICEINEYKYVGLGYCSYGERKERE